MDLFNVGVSEAGPTVAVPEVDLPSSQKLQWEKELLGTYMSAHPLTEVLDNLNVTPGGLSYCDISQLESRNVGSSVRLIAMVEGIRKIATKSNKTMAVITMEDLSGRVEVVLFPEAYERNSGHIRDGVILDVRGKIDRRGESLQIICESVSADLPRGLSVQIEAETVVVQFALAADEWSDIHAMQAANDVLRRHEGLSPVVLEIVMAAGSGTFLRSRSRKVEWSEELKQDLLAVKGVMDAKVLQHQEARLAS